MPLDQNLTRRSFEKLQRQLGKISSKLAPENVHRFRTCARRVEVLLDEVLPETSRNEKKLVKLLARSRKRAGRVRDLDMQVSLLGTLKFPQAGTQKAQLLRSLIEKREKAEKKLRKSLDRMTVAEMRRRLQKTADRVQIRLTVEPVEIALGLFRSAGRDGGSMTEEMLHQYRIAGKRARYVAELGGTSPAAERVATELKRMQDVIGDWHDWLQLTERAEAMFGKAQDSALVAELTNVTRAKFREAAAAVPATKAILSKPAAIEVVVRKRTVSVEEEPAA